MTTKHDPDNYLKLSEPFDGPDEANAALAAFRPDDSEKYTPDWARSQFGDMPTFQWRGPDGQTAAVTILWAKEDAWLTDTSGEGSVAIPIPTKGAARRLVAALRECFE